MDAGIGSIIQIVSVAFANLIANGIVIFALCFAIGQSIKKVSFLKFVPNNNIPFICMIVGAACALLAPSLFINDPIIVRIFKGIILGWSSTGLYEMIRNKNSNNSPISNEGVIDNKQ